MRDPMNGKERHQRDGNWTNFVDSFLRPGFSRPLKDWVDFEHRNGFFFVQDHQLILGDEFEFGRTESVVLNGGVGRRTSCQTRRKPRMEWRRKEKGDDKAITDVQFKQGLACV